jgi:hypothetical protein
MAAPMAKCKCCDREISRRAERCPQCGEPRRLFSGAFLGLGKWMAVAGIIALAVHISSADASGLLVIGGFIWVIASCTHYF